MTNNKNEDARQSLKEQFRPVSKETRASALGGPAILSGSPNKLAPLSVYHVLKASFGMPNGFILPEDEKVTWEYQLQGPNSCLTVHDWKFWDWTIGILHLRNEPTGYEENARKDAAMLVDLLTLSVRSLGLKDEGYDVEIIPNVYLQNYSTGEYFMREFQSKEMALNEQNKAYELKRGASEEVAAKQIEEYMNSNYKIVLDEQSMMSAAATAFVLSIEALFNIVYEIYLKPELRVHDETVRAITASLTQKWVLASVLCTCFEHSLTKDMPEFGALKYLTQVRNNLAHSNITQEMRTRVVVQDRLRFLAHVAEAKGKYSIVPGVSNVSTAKKIQSDVDSIREAILLAMTVKHRDAFREALRYPNLLVQPDRELLRPPREDEA